MSRTISRSNVAMIFPPTLLSPLVLQNLVAFDIRIGEGDLL